MTEERNEPETSAAKNAFVLNQRAWREYGASGDKGPSPELLDDGWTFAGKLEERLQQRVRELEAALAPIVEYVRVNDNDTLSRMRKDDFVVATASGSWNSPAPITLGDLRKIVDALGGAGEG